MSATDKAAADLRCELDAMRLARAEDAKTCARLTARVKELEAEVANLRWLNGGKVTLHGAYSCADGQHAWVQANDAAFQVCNRCPAERVMPLATATLAEGTRDERAARCAGCAVPCEVTSQHGMCVACEAKRRCECADAYFEHGRCWRCAGVP